MTSSARESLDLRVYRLLLDAWATVYRRRIRLTGEQWLTLVQSVDELRERVQKLEARAPVAVSGDTTEGTNKP